MRNKNTVARLAVLFLSSMALAASTVSCAHLNQFAKGGNGAALTPPPPPKVQATSVKLVKAPTKENLAAYFCDQRVHIPPPLPSPCRVFGPILPREAFQFVFATELEITNVAPIPIPVAELLAAFKAYPQATSGQNLGAVCVSFCASGQNCPQNDPNACKQSGRDIRTLNDFAGATANFLFAIVTGQESIENLKIRTIAPNEKIKTVVRFGLDPITTIDLIGRMSKDTINSVERGQMPTLSIPYEFEGTLWINVEHFGRIAADIPKISGKWDLL